jgi:hypothetical protein
MTIDRGWKQVPIFAGFLAILFCSRSVTKKNVVSVCNKRKMEWITARSVLAKVVENLGFFTFAKRDGANKPCVGEPVRGVEFFVDSYLPVSTFFHSFPVPTSARLVDFDLAKKAVYSFVAHVRYVHGFRYVHDTIIQKRKKCVELFAPVPGWTDEQLAKL